jgi:hypothetical protein
MIETWAEALTVLAIAIVLLGIVLYMGISPTRKK